MTPKIGKKLFNIRLYTDKNIYLCIGTNTNIK